MRLMGALLFNAAFGFYVVGICHSAVGFVSKKDVFFTVAIVSVTVGFFFHSLFLVFSAVEGSSVPMVGLRESLAFFAWTVSLCFLLSYYRYRIQALSLFVLPLVTVLMLGTVFIKSSPIPDALRSTWVYLHSTMLFLAYGMFFVTFVAGLLYLFQESELKNKKPKTFYYHFPSLMVLDDLFSKFLMAGFVFMTLGLLAGIIWAEKDWVSGWYNDPKVIAAFATWGIYLILLYLRITAGWRGKRAAWMSTAGFISVLFTFLGSTYFGGQHIF